MATHIASRMTFVAAIARYPLGLRWSSMSADGCGAHGAQGIARLP